MTDLALNHRLVRVILVAFVSHVGSEYIRTGKEDLAGRCWCNLSRRHEQPLRFLCGRVSVSYTSSPSPGHCHPHRLCGLGCCKGIEPGEGQHCAQRPHLHTVGTPQQPGHCFLLTIASLLPLLSSAFLEVTQPPAQPEKQSRKGPAQDPRLVPMVCPQGTGMNMEGRCDLSTGVLGPQDWHPDRLAVLISLG